MRRLKVLLSAYACEPGKGSEPGVGWNMALHLARHHDVWVLTRSNNRQAIEAELQKRPVPGLHVVYHDLPSWARFWKKGQRGVQLYYYLWQISAVPLVRKLHREVGFDVLHHVTFVKYWAPSALAFIKGPPFVWGPVGGGESAPFFLWFSLGFRGFIYEVLRTVARFLGELDPLVRFTARRAHVALATTEETARRLGKIGARRVRLLSQVALPDEAVQLLTQMPPFSGHPVRFVSIGRLLAWKGFHLGLAAFSRSGLGESEYWIIGDGPERGRLESLAHRLGIGDRVRFLGWLPRDEVLSRLAECHVLVHPSLHDSGGWVSLEAMAAGRPVICLALGGPAAVVTEETGVKVPATTPSETIWRLASAMRRMAEDPTLREGMGQRGRERVLERFSWEKRVLEVAHLYGKVLISGL